MLTKRTHRTAGCAMSLVLPAVLAAIAAPGALADVATWGGNEEGTKVEAEFKIYQDQYEWAQGVSFTNYNKDMDINGWNIIITDFSDADSSQPADREIDAEAWGESVGNGEEVVINSDQWLDGEWNEQGLKDVVWTDESRGTAKAMPDHYWSIGYPVPVDGMAGFFSHTFTLSNDDPEFTLRVTGLSFLPTMDRHGPWQKLSDLVYDGDVIEDFELFPGEEWTMDIITEGDYLDGYIYFRYGLFDCDGVFQVCQAWGGHPVVLPQPVIEPCEGDTNGDGVVDILDLLTVLSAWGPCP